MRRGRGGLLVLDVLAQVLLCRSSLVAKRKESFLPRMYSITWPCMVAAPAASSAAGREGIVRPWAQGMADNNAVAVLDFGNDGDIEEE